MQVEQGAAGKRRGDVRNLFVLVEQGVPWHNYHGAKDLLSKVIAWLRTQRASLFLLLIPVDCLSINRLQWNDIYRTM